MASTYVEGQGTVPIPGNPAAVAAGAAAEANESGMVGGRGDLCERFPETCTERPLARFGGTVGQLTLRELRAIINGKLANLEEGKKLYGGGLVTKVTTTTGEELWFVPVMGVDPQGNLVVKGTEIYNDIASVESAVKKISDLAWLAAAGQSLRDIAATADVGTLKGVGQAANQVRKSIAARKAASVLAPKGGHYTDFADEAADIMESAARSRGLTPNANVVNMAIPRKKISEKITGKQKGIDYHLDDHIPELIGKADKGLVEYWRKEVHHLIDEMESWGGRLSSNDDVMNAAAKYRERLEAILNKRLRDLEG